jgi:hypothetical protein
MATRCAPPWLQVSLITYTGWCIQALPRWCILTRARWNKRRLARPKDTAHCKHRASSYRVSESTQVDGIEHHLSRSPLVSSSSKKSRGSVILSIPRSPQPRFLTLNQRIMHSKRVTETDASSITTIILASLPPHLHVRHLSRRSPFRRDQAQHIYVHPTEDARTSFSRVRLLLNACMRMSSNHFACVDMRSSCFGST